GAGRDLLDDGPRRRAERALARQMTRRAVGRRELDRGCGAGFAAKQSEWRRGHALHAQGARRIRVLQQSPNADRSAAAAIAPGAARVGIDLIALDANR